MFRALQGAVLLWSINTPAATAAVGRNLLRRKFAQEPPVTDEPNGTQSLAIMPTVVRHDGHLVEF
jgi:hypothetical protein